MTHNIPSGAEAYKNPEIELRDGRLVAKVSPYGAYLNELFLEDGGQQIPMLFPKTQVETANGLRTRGGSHVCLPAFGPSEHLDSHGFGRDVLWHPLGSIANGAAFRLEVGQDTEAKGADQYQGLKATVDYQIKDDPEEDRAVLNMSLTVYNDGDKPMLVAPGFHPYLARPQEGAGEITEFSIHAKNGRGLLWFKRYAMQDLSTPDQARKVSDGSRELNLNNRVVSLRTSGLPVSVIWSDKPADYVCFEPTAAGRLSAENLAGSTIFPMEDPKIYTAELSWPSNQLYP